MGTPYERRSRELWKLRNALVHNAINVESYLSSAELEGWVHLQRIGGGRLIYVTCSIFREENHEQIAAFTERNPGFAPLDHIALWADRFSAGANAARLEPTGIVLTPATSGTDGFFFAAMRRAA